MNFKNFFKNRPAGLISLIFLIRVNLLLSGNVVNSQDQKKDKPVSKVCIQIEEASVKPAVATLNSLKKTPLNFRSSQISSLQNSPAGQTQGQVVIMQEDFEENFPNDNGWDVRSDVNSGNAGYGYIWGAQSYRKNAGNMAGWCADLNDKSQPDLNPPGPYPNDMKAWMIFGPFDLSDATAAMLEFHSWVESEETDDYLFWGASTNGENFCGYGLSGGSKSWTQRSLDFTNIHTVGNLCGESQVWIAFLFKSDSTYAYEGAYVDDIVLTKETGTGSNHIVSLEYFFDTDPGYGQGMALPFTWGTDISIDHNLDISALSDGIHVLFVRARDENGAWALTNQTVFLKGRIPVDELPRITRLEYFIDTDPGLGKGTAVNILPDSTLEHDFIVDVSGLSNGVHVVYVRAQDNLGNWSLTHCSAFTKESFFTDLPDITAIAYYFTDGDFTSETTIVSNFTAADNVNVSFIADVSNLALDKTYQMHVYGIDENGLQSLEHVHDVRVSLTGIDEIVSGLPQEYELSQNYPNPFNPATSIKFALPETAHIKLTIYNELGEKVTELCNRKLKAGYHAVKWDGSGLASGVYYARLTSDEFVAVKKMILLK